MQRRQAATPDGSAGAPALHVREVNLDFLTGICAGLHKPRGQSIAEKMLFMVATMAAEMERDLIREHTRWDNNWLAHRRGSDLAVLHL